ncbi:MAG TPA: glycosyltransferase family 4 protein [Tepidisphaeraceae bacterium]
MPVSSANPRAPRPTGWRPLRIAVIGGRGVPSGYSGVEKICEELFADFAARGHRPTIYCRPAVLEQSVSEHRGVRLVRTPAPGGKNGETLSHSLLSLLHAVTRGDDGAPFDLVSLHTVAPNLFAPIAAAWGIPIVSHVHGLDHQREKWRGMGSRIIHLAERVMVKAASHVVVVNPSLTDYYKDVYGLSTSLLPNGIHPGDDTFTPDVQTLRGHGIEAGKYFVTVSRVVPEKRLHDVIAAFSATGGGHKLVVVGGAQHSGDYLKQLQAQADAAAPGRVVFAGHQGGDALRTLFGAAAAYVSASELEGMPSSVLECMEYNVPAILSDIDAHRAITKPIATYDWHFAVGDVAALSRRMASVAADPASASVTAAACRAHVRQHFAWPVLAQRTEALYLRVANATAEDETVPQTV